MALALLLLALPAWTAPDAEYAVRWSPRDGGLQDLQAVAAVLGIDGKTASYEVRYYMVDHDGGPAILRERIRGGRVDVTYKLRGTVGFPAGAAATWRCPLRHEDRRKDEVDVSIVDVGPGRRAYSRSCTAKAPFDKAVPTTWKPTPQGCRSAMRRRESADQLVTIEEWRMGDGEVLLEVSMLGPDTDASERTFRESIMNRIAVVGFRPLDRSKTEAGMRPCR